jgi:hypothetical protein
MTKPDVVAKIIIGNDQPNAGVGFVGVAGCKSLTSSEILSNNIVSPFPPLLPSQLDESINTINSRLKGRFDHIDYYNGSGVPPSGGGGGGGGGATETVDLTVTVNADDGYGTKGTLFNNSNPGTYNGLATTGGSTIFMGGFYNDDESEYSFAIGFFRFRNLTVAQGTTITSATFKFTKSGGTGSTSQDLTLAALDSTTGIGTAAIGGVALAHSNHTSATVAFPNLMGSSNDQKTSPDIKTIVQEIVNRSDWSSGDNITIVCYAASIPTNTTARIEGRGKEFSSGSAVAELSVTYSS